MIPINTKLLHSNKSKRKKKRKSRKKSRSAKHKPFQFYGRCQGGITKTNIKILTFDKKVKNNHSVEKHAVNVCELIKILRRIYSYCYSKLYRVLHINLWQNCFSFKPRKRALFISCDASKVNTVFIYQYQASQNSKLDYTIG